MRKFRLVGKWAGVRRCCGDVASILAQFPGRRQGDSAAIGAMSLRSSVRTARCQSSQRLRKIDHQAHKRSAHSFLIPKRFREQRLR